MPPLGATNKGVSATREGRSPWGMPGGEREARAKAVGRRSWRGRSPQEAAGLSLVKKKLKRRLAVAKNGGLLRKINNLQNLWIGHPSRNRRSSVTLS